MNSQFAQCLSVQKQLLLCESVSEARVIRPLSAKGSVQADDPEGTECALLELAVAVGIHSSANHGFVSLLVGGSSHAAVPLREFANFLVPSVPSNSTGNAHGSFKKLQVREHDLQATKVAGVCYNRAIQSLLALALLLEQVASAVALIGNTTAARLPDTFFSAAVGLHLWHGWGV